MQVARLAALIAGLGAAASPALSLDVLDSVLQVTYEHAGESYVFTDHVVPLLPGNACYTWYIQSAQASAPLVVIERMTLPIGIDWGPSVDDPQSPTKVEQGGKIATTTLPMTSDGAGWFSHGWCVAEGDPPGQHTIEVSVDTQPLAAFHFEVVAPEAYAFPLKALSYADRSAHLVW